jgi:hypothetical protein
MRICSHMCRCEHMCVSAGLFSLLSALVTLEQTVLHIMVSSVDFVRWLSCSHHKPQHHPLQSQGPRPALDRHRWPCSNEHHHAFRWQGHSESQAACRGDRPCVPRQQFLRGSLLPSAHSYPRYSACDIMTQEPFHSVRA